MLFDFLFGAVFLYCVMIANEDWKTMIVPDLFLIILFAAGVLYGFQAAGSAGNNPGETASTLAYRSAIPGLFGLAVTSLYRVLRGRDGMGLGDVKLMAAAGVWLPLSASFFAVAAASLAAIAILVMVALIWKGADAISRPFPFAVFLAPAFWLSWLFEGIFVY
jgi:leader peptidase (prepilin peptidase)/N-methyltransferase